METLTKFQLRSLRDAANSENGTYLLIYPSITDPVCQQNKWGQNHIESGALIGMGLLADVSSQFQRHIDAQYRETGRYFRAFRITDTGRAMFDKRNQASCLKH